MAKQPCKSCHEAPKHGTSHRCIECGLRTKPMVEQIEAAQARLALVPPELRRTRVPEKEWPPGRRWCAGCQSFVRTADCTGSRCKAGASAAAHRGAVTRNFGISADAYAELFAAQKGRCYLCGKKSTQRLAVDHDHACCPGPTSCGRCVRGLLCAPERGCNRALVGTLEWLARGDAGAAVALARRLADYLENPPARRILGNTLTTV